MGNSWTAVELEPDSTTAHEGGEWTHLVFLPPAMKNEWYRERLVYNVSTGEFKQVWFIDAGPVTRPFPTEGRLEYLMVRHFIHRAIKRLDRDKGKWSRIPVTDRDLNQCDTGTVVCGRNTKEFTKVGDDEWIRYSSRTDTYSTDDMMRRADGVAMVTETVWDDED